MAEQQSDISRSSRSAGPSPNGHNGGRDDDSSNTGSNDQHQQQHSSKKNGKFKSKGDKEKIRIGPDYQAVCPELVSEIERKPDSLNDKALLVWSPTKNILESEMDEYITNAIEKYGYNAEQALGMLFWHKHDLERAVLDLPHFSPLPDEWTVEDKLLFEQAFNFHGKSFSRIRQILPDKSMASLVTYYYSWKNTRNRRSVMDRQEKSKPCKNGLENGSDNNCSDEDNNDEKAQNIKPFLQTTESSATGSAVSGNTSAQISIDWNCPANNFKQLMLTAVQVKSSQPNNTNRTNNAAEISASNTSISTNSIGIRNASGDNFTMQIKNANGDTCTSCKKPSNLLIVDNGALCNSCFNHWRRAGIKWPISGSFGTKYRNVQRNKRKPPRGWNISRDDIVELANASNSKQEDNLERKIATLSGRVQKNKQKISNLKKKAADIEDFKLMDNNNRINSMWTNPELLMAVQGVRKYGKQFQTIADIIGTKTEAHIRTFFVNYRRRYNLDNVLKEYEEEQQQEKSSPNEDVLMVEDLPQNVDVDENAENKIKDQMNNLESRVMEIDLDNEISS